MSAPRYSVTCRFCAAAPGEPCRSRTSGSVTDAHRTRVFYQGEWEFRDRHQRLMASLAEIDRDYADALTAATSKPTPIGLRATSEGASA